jgi:subtilisin
MKRARLVGLMVLLVGMGSLLFGGCTQYLSPTQALDPMGLLEGENGRAKVLIGFSARPVPAQLATLRELGGEVRHVYDLIPAVAADVPGAVVSDLRRALGAVYVEPDSRVSKTDAELEAAWGVKRIGAGVVHDNGFTGAGVIVAILDTGVEYTHPQLSQAFSPPYYGYDFVNGDANPIDDEGHGTHVAGTIAAADDGVGVVGVAPGASLLAYKVLDETGSGYMSWVIAGIDQAVEDDADVINMSLSGSASATLEAACQAAYDQGVVLVASAGNSGNPPGRGDNVEAPAEYPSVIAVSATDDADERPRWSSTGNALELAAPGVDVYSTYLNGGYATGSGTSMSAPHVTGTVALLIGTDTQGVWTPDAVRSALIASAEDLGAPGWDTKYGYGLVNADGACGLEEPPPPPPPPGSMYIAEMDVSLVFAGPWVRVQAGVMIAGEAGAVDGAAVTGHWNGAVGGSVSGTTDASGWVTFRSDKIRNPLPGAIFGFCVDSVTKSDWLYDPDLNQVEECIDVVVP